MDPEAGGGRRAFERLDLRDVMTEAAETARARLTAAHHLTVRRPREPVPVMGDRDPLCRILASLLDNAIRYSPEGGPVHCGVEVDGAAAVCRVIDRGIGIAEADLPILFSRFGRIGGGGGDGLALHLCRELALLHGGDIAVESAPGVGSAFSLVLPVAGAAQPPAYDLTRFGLGDMIACSAAIRDLGAGAEGFDDAAGRIVRHLQAALRDGPGDRPAAALVRLFRARPLAALDEERRAAALGALEGQEAGEDLLCLALAASAGDRQEWNDPARSQELLALPLPVGSAWPPLATSLLADLGFGPAGPAGQEPFADLLDRTRNVFHVGAGSGSPYLPVPDGPDEAAPVRSVLGFGGALAPADLYALLVCSRAEVPPGCASLFRGVSHSAKLALAPFAG